MKDIGQTWHSAREQGVLRGVSSLARAAKQVIFEGRLVEMSANLGREFVSPHLHPVIEAGKPVYSLAGAQLVAERESPLSLAPLDAQLDGVCHTNIDGAHAWAWTGPSLMTTNMATGGTEEVHRFPSEIKTMHATAHGHLIVALWGSVHLSSDGGARFDEVLRLSHDWSKVIPGTLAEDGKGRLLVGEYGNARDNRGRWEPTAWLHRSDDHGSTWSSSDFIIRAGVNKHIHVVAACPWTGRLFVTSGDNRKWLWSSDIDEKSREASDLGGWQRAGRGPWRRGGYTAVAFTSAATYWGTDYWMGTNFVVADYRHEEPVTWLLGSKLRRNPIPSMAVVPGQAGNHVLATSANKYRSDGASAILAFNETEREWMTLLLDPNGEAGGVVIAQCSADRGASWAHVRLRGRSFIASDEAMMPAGLSTRHK